jgi:hypothetical protein
LVNTVLKENNIKLEKPRYQYDPISEELQDVNAPGWAEKATKQMEGIKKKPLVAKQTKSPELTGVDRYIRAKKI